MIEVQRQYLVVPYIFGFYRVIPGQWLISIQRMKEKIKFRSPRADLAAYCMHLISMDIAISKLEKLHVEGLNDDFHKLPIRKIRATISSGGHWCIHGDLGSIVGWNFNECPLRLSNQNYIFSPFMTALEWKIPPGTLKSMSTGPNEP